MPLQPFIDALEEFSARHGVAVFRTPLSPWVVGRMDENQIVLRRGLSEEQQLLTLVHELTHFLAHRPDAPLNRTVCEYEAEAVEKLVAGQLGLKVAGTEIEPQHSHGRPAGLLCGARALGDSDPFGGGPTTGVGRRRDRDTVR